METRFAIEESTRCASEYVWAYSVAKQVGEPSPATNYMPEPPVECYEIRALGEPVGRGPFGPVHPVLGVAYLVIDKRGRAELDFLYVYPQYRGRGVAKRLVEQAIEFARGKGAKTMLCIIFREDVREKLRERLGLEVDVNPEASRRIAMSLGFKEIEDDAFVLELGR